MAIPALNDFGLLPEGIHQCAPRDVMDKFCANPARVAVWRRFEGFLRWAAAKPGPILIFMDGSFVTDKPIPGDIDVAIDITDCAKSDQDEWIIAFHREHEAMKRQFNTDFYLIYADRVLISQSSSNTLESRMPLAVEHRLE